MTLDHTPSPIITPTFSKWLDFCLIGAEELDRLTEEARITTQAMYDRPLTPQQERIRAACRKSACRHIAGQAS